MGVISNGTTLLDAGSLDSGVATGAMTLLSTVTASSSATVSFTSGINSTYKEYQVHYSDVHPATDNVNFLVNFRDGSSAFDATKTTTFFSALHSEADGTPQLLFETGQDIAQGTGYQNLVNDVGNGADESVSGEMFLFSPSSTTFVKHFISRVNSYHNSNITQDNSVAGYCNVTAAIDGVDFKITSGNIDSGVIKMYGLSK